MKEHYVLIHHNFSRTIQSLSRKLEFNMKHIFILTIALFFSGITIAQPFTHQDTLRGSVTPERAWWDLSYYDLAFEFDIAKKSIKGTNTIYFFVTIPQQVMQIDLQEPMAIKQVDYKGQN